MKHTAHMEDIKGFRFLVPNMVTEHDAFYISYNNYDIGIYGSDTTALVGGDGQGPFYILNGDHREEYGKRVSLGFQACLDYFKDNMQDIAKYSEKPGFEFHFKRKGEKP